MEGHIEFVLLEIKRLRTERWTHPLVVALALAATLWQFAPYYFTVSAVFVSAYIAEVRAEIQLAMFRLEHARLLRDHEQLFLAVGARLKADGIV